MYPERQGNAADQRLLKALPRNSDGAIAQSGFFVRQYKNSQAVVELLTRIFVKYDGKDASKCAMRGLRGNALKYSLTKFDRTGIIGIMVQNSTKTQPETASVRMHPVLRRICRHEKEDCRRTRPASALTKKNPIISFSHSQKRSGPVFAGPLPFIKTNFYFPDKRNTSAALPMTTI